MTLNTPKKRGGQRKFTDRAKPLFKQLYIDEKLSSVMMGKLLGVSSSTVLENLRRFNILIRTISEANIGRKHTDETKRNMSKGHTGKKRKPRSEETKRKISDANKGRKQKPFTEKARRKLSAYHQGCSLDEWKGYVSFEPYCEKFNYDKKEEIRNQYRRVCVVSGVSALQNGQRLSVDHADENKQQGCGGIKWRLVPLTRKVHGKMNNKQNHFLLELLLYGNQKAELNYEFE